MLNLLTRTVIVIGSKSTAVKLHVSYVV